MIASLLLLPALAWAGRAAPKPLTMDQEVAGVVDALYDLRFEEAERACRALEKKYPGHPAGPFFLAIGSYQLYLQNVPASGAALDAFERESDNAVATAEAFASSQPAVGQFYLGATEGFQARALISARRLSDAVSKARQAVKHLKRARELDPALEDAQLGIGMYDFFMAQLPGPAKALAYAVTGLWGDRERGLKAIQIVADSTGPARMEARAVLSAIYASDKEKEWAKARSLLEELAKRYPGNPLYRLRLAYVLERQQHWDEAAQAADPAGGWVAKLRPDLQGPARAAGALRKAEALLYAGKPNEAKALLDAFKPAELSPKLREGLEYLRRNFPAPPHEPSKPRWPLAGLPSDRR